MTFIDGLRYEELTRVSACDNATPISKIHKIA
jgi:hypothetical protein